MYVFFSCTVFTAVRFFAVFAQFYGFCSVLRFLLSFTFFSPRIGFKRCRPQLAEINFLSSFLGRKWWMFQAIFFHLWKSIHLESEEKNGTPTRPKVKRKNILKLFLRGCGQSLGLSSISTLITIHFTWDEKSTALHCILGLVKNCERFIFQQIASVL
jgi:hypothetical protein